MIGHKRNTNRSSTRRVAHRSVNLNVKEETVETMFKIDRKDADARVVAAQAVKPPPEPPKIEVAPDPIERRLLYTLRDSMSFVAVHESVHGTKRT
jgi:hypothetical protein